MSLLLDGPPSSIEDLTNQDSGLLDVCRVEQIDLSTKLLLAQDHLAIELQSLLDQQRNAYTVFSDRPVVGVQNVAVTPSLKLWHTWLTLAFVYRDVYFNQLNDRFKAKWTEYQRLAEEEKLRLRALGVGLVLAPLAAPASPVLASTPAAEIGGAFYVAVSLVNGANAESAPSPVASIQLLDGNAIHVTFVSAAPNATGWNVYVGKTPATLTLQISPSLALESDWVFYPSTLVSSGMAPAQGQVPDLLKALPQRLQRG
jgi:hypothetical protein